MRQQRTVRRPGDDSTYLAHTFLKMRIIQVFSFAAAAGASTAGYRPLIQEIAALPSCNFAKFQCFGI